MRELDFSANSVAHSVANSVARPKEMKSNVFSEDSSLFRQTMQITTNCLRNSLRKSFQPCRNTFALPQIPS